jgi:molybdopterin converting factor small subunit
MDILESVILMKFEKYRCKAGRDVFLLPENKDITLFKNIFDMCLEFYEDVNTAIYSKRTIIKEDKANQKKRNIKYQSENKEKIKEQQQEYLNNNKEIITELRKEYAKEYNEKNADMIATKQKKYYEENKKEIISQAMEHYKDNKEVILEERKEFYENNKKHILAERKRYHKENYETKIKAQRSAKELCECGMIISHYGMKRHKGTDRHLKLMEKLKIKYNLSI